MIYKLNCCLCPVIILGCSNSQQRGLNTDTVEGSIYQQINMLNLDAWSHTQLLQVVVH